VRGVAQLAQGEGTAPVRVRRRGRGGRALSLAIAAALLPGLAAAGVRPAWGGTIRIGVPGAPGAAADPDRAMERLVARAVSAPLLDVDAAGRLVPGALAEVPRAEAGATAFRLRVRPGLTDAAGRPLGAEAVAARLRSLLDQGPGSPDAWVALPIVGADAVLEGRAQVLAGVEVLSADELLVTLSFPLPELPFLLAATPAALPDAGAFLPVPRRSAREPLVLVANPRHHRGRPFAAKIELRPVDARTAARLSRPGPDALDLVLRPEAAGGGLSFPLPALEATVAVVNGERLGAAAAPVRRALASLDRAELARRFVRGPAAPLATLVPPALLAQAPPSPASAPPRAPRAAPGRIAVLADASAADQRALAERIQVKLFDGGVRAGVELLDAEPFRARLLAGDYDVALVSVPALAPVPAVAAAQIVYAARGSAAALRALSELAGLREEEALDAADRLARDLDLVPLVASGLRASPGAALQGLAPAADGTIDLGDLWLLGGGVR
jgi:peptide/nickel transport system substrate-binding protein